MCSGWSPAITKVRGNYSPLLCLIISSYSHELIMPAEITKGAAWIESGEDIGSEPKPGKDVCLIKGGKKSNWVKKPPSLLALWVDSLCCSPSWRKPRMKTSSSTKKKQLIKVFFPWSFDQDDDGKNICSFVFFFSCKEQVKNFWQKKSSCFKF